MRDNEAGRVATGTLTGTALLLALGVVLPIVFHAIPLGGRIFLPMHLPTFVAGLVLGPVAGLVVGTGSPVLSGLLTGRPTVFYMIPMILELATYGLVSGLLRRRFEAVALASLFGVQFAFTGTEVRYLFSAVYLGFAGALLVAGGGERRSHFLRLTLGPLARFGPRRR